MSPAKSATKKAVKKSAKKSILTDEEIAAFKETVKERKALERANQNKEEAEKLALAAIAQMQEPDRSMARRIHAIIKANAPDLWAKTWYGMPAYARGDRVICFFQSAAKFKARYATLGFNDGATLDEGVMWPVAFALKALTPAEEARIAALVKKAVS